MEENNNNQSQHITGQKLTVFTMKFEGNTYKEIAEKTKYSENYLKKCLQTKGKWREAYNAFEEECLEEIEQEGRRRIKKRISEALTVEEHLLTLITTNPREAGRAARDLLDRAGLRAPEKIEITDPDDKAEKMLKAMEKRKAEKGMPKKENE